MVIEITITDWRKQNVQSMRVEDTATCDTCLRSMVRRQGLPTRAIDGAPIEYRLQNAGTTLSSASTLVASDVKEGDTLCIYPMREKDKTRAEEWLRADTSIRGGEPDLSILKAPVPSNFTAISDQVRVLYIGLCIIVFILGVAIIAKGHDIGEDTIGYVADYGSSSWKYETYGGDAYTGIQNAVVDGNFLIDDETDVLNENLRDINENIITLLQAVCVLFGLFLCIYSLYKLLGLWTFPYEKE